MGGPIEIVRIILIILCQINWLFEGFTMLKSSPKFADNSKVGEIYVFWSDFKWAWQNGSTAPPGTQPLGFPSTDLHKNRSPVVS